MDTKDTHLRGPEYADTRPDMDEPYQDANSEITGKDSVAILGFYVALALVLLGAWCVL